MFSAIKTNEVRQSTVWREREIVLRQGQGGPDNADVYVCAGVQGYQPAWG